MDHVKKDHQLYWETATSSKNRSDSPIYLKNKASELATLVKLYCDEPYSTIDIGCGAGELLYYIADHLNVTTAIDYSDSMLTEAKKKLSNKNEINFLRKDILNYGNEITERIWITTGAASQYLDKLEIKEMITIFNNNKNSHAFFLFDTIDPIRYRLTPWNIGYNQKGKKSFKLNIYYFYRKITAILHLLFNSNKTTHKLESPAMGYAHLPTHWLNLAAEQNLNIDIVSSRYFEYRYHVILTKKNDKQ